MKQDSLNSISETPILKRREFFVTLIETKITTDRNGSIGSKAEIFETDGAMRT